VPSWTLHAEVDEDRAAAIAAVPPLEWSQVAHEDWQLTTEAAAQEPFEVQIEPAEQSEAAAPDPLESAQASLQALAVDSQAENSSADGLAAGAFVTLVAGMISSEASSLLEAAVMTEDAAARALSGIPMQGVEGMPGFLASSLLLASAVATAMGGAGPSEAIGSYSSGLQALNSTAQKLWEHGTGSLGERASRLLTEAGKLWATFDDEFEDSSQELVSPASLGIAARTGSARREGKDWILPVEAQLFQRNEGRHAMVLGLCKQLLFRTLHGVSEKDFEGRAGQLYEERARLIFRSLQLPLSSERSLQRLEIRIGGRQEGDGGWRKLPPTDAYGLSEVNVRFADSEVALADRLRGRISVEVRLADSPLNVEENMPTAAPVRTVAHLVGEEGLGVISDIDDTVKVTEVFHGIKAVLKNTFLKDFKPVHGMAELFQGWQRERGASFHYVSKSPPELHAPLSEFLRREGFPVSSVHLCPLINRERANFKMRQVTSLLEQFPGRKFLLVGDSGEKDAEVYAEILRRHPDQVLKAFIRDVAPGERSERARAAFQGLESEKWQVFSEPSEVTLSAPDGPSGWPEWLKMPGVPKTAASSVVKATTESLKRFGWKPASIPLAGVVVD